MTHASRLLARRHPLVARAIGVVAGRTLIARSNWDILEVRDLGGELVMRHEVALEGEPLLDDVRFAGACLVVELSGGVCALGARAYHFDRRAWGEPIERHCDETGLVGAGPGWLAIADIEGVDVIDVATTQVRRRIPTAGVRSIDAHPDHPDVWLVAAEGDGTDGARGELAVVEGSTVRARCDLSAWDPCAAWIDAGRVLVASPRGPLRILDGALREQRMLPCSKVAPSSIRVARGRWAALLDPPGGSLLVDLESGASQQSGDVCFVEPDGEHVLWADASGAWRERLAR